MNSFGKNVLMIYALGMAVGGVLGALKGSMISLVAGGACAVLLMLCYVKASKSPKAAFGYGALIGVLMAGQMFMRFQKTHNFMPAGLISAMSLLSALLLLVAWAKTTNSVAE